MVASGVDDDEHLDPYTRWSTGFEAVEGMQQLWFVMARDDDDHAQRWRRRLKHLPGQGSMLLQVAWG
jgi:hypothetical protein